MTKFKKTTKLIAFLIGYYWRVSTRWFDPSHTLYLSHEGGQCSPIPLKDRILYKLGITTKYIKDAVEWDENPATVRGSSII